MSVSVKHKRGASIGMLVLASIHLYLQKYMHTDILTPHHSKRCKINSIFIPYSRKFLWGPNFCDFCNPRPKHESKNRKIRTAKFWTHELLHEFMNLEKFWHTCVCALVSLDLKMALYRYFKPADECPTLSHGTSFVPGDGKGMKSIAKHEN